MAVTEELIKEVKELNRLQAIQQAAMKEHMRQLDYVYDKFDHYDISKARKLLEE